MRRAITIVVVLASVTALTGCTLWGEHKPTAWTDITGGESLERVYWHELKAKNWTSLETHLAPNFVLATASGSFDHDGAIEHWKQLEIQDYSLGEFKTELNGNTYIVSYMLSIHAKFAGQPLPATSYRCMTVWQRQRREEWQAIAHSATAISQSR
jgi:hypothetical protein